MTPKRIGELRSRLATWRDAELLAGFTCARPRPWERDVEEYVQGPARREHLNNPRPGADAQLWLFFDDADRLVAVAGIERGAELSVDAAHVTVVALALDARGAVTPLGRLSDVVIEEVIREGLEAFDTDTAFAHVDDRNEASLDLCVRVGLNVTMGGSRPGTRRLVGRFQV